MKKHTLVGAIFALLGAGLAVFILVLCFQARTMPIQLPEGAAAPEASAQELMEAIHRQDFDAAAQALYGQPELLAEAPSSELVNAFWQVFSGGITYEFTSGCYTTTQGIYRDVTIQGPDIPAIMPALERRYKALLNEREFAAPDKDLIWDENGDYRENFLIEVLTDAAKDVLSQDIPTASWNIILELVCRDGKWWVLPQEDLTQVLSGGMAQ